MVNEGFLKEINYNMLLISDDIKGLLSQMNQYSAPDIPKWITEDLKNEIPSSYACVLPTCLCVPAQLVTPPPESLCN